MPVHIIEFKARVKSIAEAENLLKTLHPVFKGEDHQRDTYFDVTEGRLKLREGQIENALIWYHRPEAKGHKHSEVLLHKHVPGTDLKGILQKLHGIKIVVDKKRRIYFIENVKFHFDQVEELGQFIEVEAIDESGDLGMDKIKQQCAYYADFFGIQTSDYIGASYSDLLMMKQQDASPFPIIKTSRLLLRKIEEEDIHEVFRGLSHREVTRHFAVHFNTLEATQEQMKWYADMIANNTGRCWAICSPDNQIFYGVCSLNTWKQEHQKAELGHWLFPEHWHTGIATEAITAILNYGFEQMNLHRISAEVEPANTASSALLKKLGFKKEGMLEDCEYKNGHYLSLEMYALLQTNHKN